MCDPQVRFCERPGGESPRAYSTGSLERAQAWKAEANVRRRGVGNPEPTCEVALFGCD